MVYLVNQGRLMFVGETTPTKGGVDPLAKSFPWNSPYAFAENDVIRSIDLDGLEKLGVTDSYYNAQRIKSLFKVKNYRKIYEIIDYGSKNPWVSDGQKQSDYIYRKNLELNGSDNLISKGRSGTILDIPTDAEKVRKFGDINDHGGYMEVEFYDYRTKKSTNLGTLPLSKINENRKLRVYRDGDDFWNIEPKFNKYDLSREIRNRVIGGTWKEVLENVSKRLGKISGVTPAIFFLDTDELQLQKAKLQIQGRLRTIGPNSVYQLDIHNNQNGKVGTYQMRYQVDDKGNESFKESFGS